MDNTFTKLCQHRRFKLPLSIVLISLVSGCFSVKPSSTKSGKKYFETFFVGEEGTQYFIKPITLEATNADDYVTLDMTFRYRNEIKDSALVNFSIKGSSLFKSIDSLKISHQDTQIKSQNISLLFNEKFKSGFSSRHTTKLSLKEIKEVFNHDEWVLTIYAQNQTSNYTPTKKSKTAILTIRDKVFVLM
jgi:hypothetical protein